MTILLNLTEEEATMAWWALWEKEQQMRIRVQQFEHTNWPPECKNAATWEANVLGIIRAKLEEIGRNPEEAQ